MPDLSFLLEALARPAGESSDFDLNPNFQMPPDRKLRAAAVLVAVGPGNGVLLTKRSSHLLHHPGQIALPGGKLDATDASLESCALRESHEEVGLPRDAVQILGRLPPHETVTGFVITPILARITRPFDPAPEQGEVDEVFTVPLSHLLDLRHYAIEQRRWQGQIRRYYAVPWGPYYVWGATARILRGLADRVAS
jgi:8-oxo-dGTP pyrophosphatase MutT (NUDIX family)